MPPRRQLLLTAWLVVAMAAECAHAQGTVGEAMLMQVLNNAGNLLNAGGNLVTTLVQPATTADVELPRCPKSHVLRSVPDDWASLTAEEQAAHPINLPVMQLAYSVYQPPKTFATCLKAMGIDSILPVTVPVPDFPLTSATAYVYKAGNSSVWVVFKGSDVSNLLQNLECGHTQPVGGRFGARSADVRLHSGFYAGWQALEEPVTAAVLEFLQEVPTGKVYVVGHSLGAALASIAALRLSRTLPAPAEVAGVWLLAAPRAGNPTWKQIYNAVLLQKTLRISNFLDIAAGLPKPLEACAAPGSTVMNLLARTETYDYAHVGRSLLMCPLRNGLVHWLVSAAGSELTDCPGAGYSEAATDATFATHLLGAYFDNWRRGLVARTGDSLADVAALQAVLCQECTLLRPGSPPLAQLAVPARAGGPVTCSVDASCSHKLAWDAATALGGGHSMDYVGPMTICSGFMCS